jgi:hypothetical protein
MKKLYTTLFVLFVASTLSAQCFMQVSCNWVTCYGACDATAQAYPVNMVQPISYQWMPGGQTTQTITGLCAGTYTCTAVDSLGCTATAQCTVGSPSQLQAMITSYQNPSCQACCDGYAVGTASGGTPAYTYQWQPTGQTTSTAQALCNGTYTLCVTDAVGCVSCDTITVSFPTTIAESVSEVQMNVWGQDRTFTLSVQFPEPTSGEILITNALGEVVSRTQFGTTTTLQQSIDMNGYAASLYLVSVVTDSGVTTRKITLK